VVEVSDGLRTGRGEAAPIYYKGETAAGCVATIEALGTVPSGTVPFFAFNGDSPQAGTVPGLRAQLQSLLPHGAARNALDCALWDLEAQQSDTPAWQLAGLTALPALPTAMTVSLDTPEAMEHRAWELAAKFTLLKLKLAGEGDLARVAAVRRGAPSARLIVDANEAWHGRDVAAEAAALLPYGIELIEQPVRAGQDHLLDGVASLIPLCADESCQDRADLPRLMGRYQAINIKLDKAGGLTEALALKAQAQAAGLKIMVGCMLCTSLAIAPAALVAQGADWVDLDGALLLARDRSPDEKWGRV
jgi:L-Ala-D/L-Glu epimerase